MKRVFSFLLVLLLVASLMPVQVMADGGTANLYVLWQLNGDNFDEHFVDVGANATVQIPVPNGYKITGAVAEADTPGLINTSNWTVTMPGRNVMLLVTIAPDNGGTATTSEYNVEVANTDNGTISVNTSKAKEGDTITVTVTPDAGYKLSWIIVYLKDADGVEYEVVNGQFTMPDGDVLVDGAFELDNGGTPQPTEHNITVTTPENGTVSGVPAKAKKDDVITVTTDPAEGYELDKITVTCGSEEIDVNTEGEFTMPAGDVTVTVTFKAKQTLPSGLSFSYAYDVWRDPDFPKKNGTFRVYRFDKPLDKNGYRIDNAGTWTLSSMGKYSSLSGSYPGLSDVADSLAREYGVSVNDMPIHKLSLNGEFVTYGVLVMHDASEPVAFFIGSNWSGGSGYLFCNTQYQYSDEKTYNVKEDVRDEVKPSNKIQITFDPNNGGATSDSKLNPGDKLNEVPSANRDDHVFTGWFTADGTPVTEDTVFNEDTTVYARWAAHTTEPANNAFRANINMADQAVVDMLVTQRDKQQGQDVRVFMNVEQLNTENVPSSDKTAIIGMAGSKKVAAFLDIQLLKQIGTATPTPIHNTETNMVPIIMKLDDEVIPSGAVKDTFTIIYHHVEDGAATTDEISANFDAATKTLTFQANKFSTYALVVKEKAPTGTLDKVVKSGDISGFNGMSMLLLCCAVALAGVAVYDKKRTK